MEELLIRLKCDSCRTQENQSMKYAVTPYKNWHRLKVKGSDKIVNLCSDECLEKYIEKIIGV